jgi:hypothetical protein
LTTYYTSRSAILESQRCPRARYIGYIWGGTGLSKVRATIPLATGSWTHEGLAFLLKTYQALGCVLESHVDGAVQVALDGYRTELAARGLDIELGEDGAYVAEEQLALVEGMLRAYAAKGLGELVEKYEVLEVEREDVWNGFAEWITHPSTGTCPRCRLGNDTDGDGNCSICARQTDAEVAETRKFIDDLKAKDRVNLQACADALLRERSTGDLYLLSFKTAAGWDYRKDGENRHDVQGLSEAAVIERRLVQWWDCLHQQRPDQNGSEQERKDLLDLVDIDHPKVKLLLEMPDRPRIMGIQMVFLIKGRREQQGDGGPYLTQSHLIRGWQREGVTDREYAWRYKWEGPDTWPDTGRLRGHTLGKGWSKFDAWSANGGVKAWIEMLTQGLVQPEVEMDPLASTYQMPLPYFRQDRDLQSFVKQAQTQERRVFEVMSEAEQVREQGDADKLLDFLDTHLETVQNRRSCDYPSKCQFQEVCFSDTSMLINPFGTGIFTKRVPHHEAEAAAAK